MEYLDEKKYRKALKKEIKAGKQLAQVYLIIFSFILPSALTTVAQSKNSEAITYLPYFASGFIVFIVIYIVVLSKYVIFTEFKPYMSNFAAIIATINFGFALPLYITFYMKENGVSLDSSPNTDFSFYIGTSIMMSILFLSPLLITTIRGEHHNEIAKEIMRIRYNEIAYWLNFFKIEILYGFSVYVCYVQTAMKIFKPDFNALF